MDLTEFLGEFQLEAGEKLDAIASQLLCLERDTTNPQPVREMFLAAHTIKGGAAMMRLTEVESLAHALEDLLSKFRDQQRTLDPATADLLFQAIDRLRGLIANASAQSVGSEPDAALVSFASRLRAGVCAPAIEAESGVRRALVVDSSATVRALYTLQLEDAGYAAETCEDGRLALSRATTERFDLLVAGLQNETLGGFELCAALRANPATRDLRVVLTSADAGPRLSHKAIECGAQSLVRKGSLRDAALTNAVQVLA
jgi:chemotaxis protein histidine kinase CheA